MDFKELKCPICRNVGFEPIPFGHYSIVHENTTSTKGLKRYRTIHVILYACKQCKYIVSQQKGLNIM